MAAKRSRATGSGRTRTTRGNRIGGRGYSRPASVDTARRTGGSNGLRAQRAGKRVGQR